MCEPHWTQYVSGLTVPVISFFGIWIAFRQKRLAESKLRFDLFEKRFKVYEGVHEFIDNILNKGNDRSAETFRFMGIVMQSKWLFHADVYGYLQEVVSRVATLDRLEREFSDSQDEDSKKKNRADQREIRNWLLNQFNDTDSIFAAYLSIT